MESVTDSNKAAVVRFNREVIEHGDAAALPRLVDDAFVNHSALPGADRGPDGMLHGYLKILKPALSNMRVEICDQVAEGDKVTTREGPDQSFRDADSYRASVEQRPVLLNSG